MADVILFHHALGRTRGITDFAEQLRSAGHRVTVPDLYEGQIFQSIEAGVAHAERLGMVEIINRGVAAAAGMPARCVYAGFSLGSLPAQNLAQTRNGALGAILYHGGIPASEFGTPWPQGVALQIHSIQDDKWGEPELVQSLIREARNSELFVYPGSAHLVADASFSEYDAAIAGLIMERTIEFLNRWE